MSQPRRDTREANRRGLVFRAGFSSRPLRLCEKLFSIPFGCAACEEERDELLVITSTDDLVTEFSRLANTLAELGRGFHARGWVLGTSGNFSAVVSERPLTVAVSRSGSDKGSLSPDQIVLVNADGKLVEGQGKPSDETLLHLAVIRSRRAGAVLHTHSVWSTLLSEAYAGDGGLEIEGYEMLKGLEGVRTHDHKERIPILNNQQDMHALAAEVQECLARHTGAHGFLLRRHGLYTWGCDLSEAKRHVEILEFLLEVIGRGPSASRA